MLRLVVVANFSQKFLQIIFWVLNGKWLKKKKFLLFFFQILHLSDLNFGNLSSTISIQQIDPENLWSDNITTGVPPHLMPSVKLNLAGVVLCKEMCCFDPMRPSWSPWWRLKKVQLTLNGVQRASICTRVSHRTLLPSKPSWLRSTFSHTAVWLRLPSSAPVRIPLGIDKCAHIALWLTVSFVFMRLPG